MRWEISSPTVKRQMHYVISETTNLLCHLTTDLVDGPAPFSFRHHVGFLCWGGLLLNTHHPSPWSFVLYAFETLIMIHSSLSSKFRAKISSVADYPYSPYLRAPFRCYRTGFLFLASPCPLVRVQRRPVCFELGLLIVFPLSARGYLYPFLEKNAICSAVSRCG